MIRVERSENPPAALTGSKSAGAKERKKSLSHYGSAATRDTPFKGYNAYKLDEVKAALNGCFRNKCAYCEIDYGGAPLDVEHFRPKSAVVELDPVTFRALSNPVTTKPGYYWLAAEWSNLLPSCIDCNRPRTQVFGDSADEVSGKSNYFPVLAGSARSLDPTVDCEVAERRLLLDPCRDHPEQHLEFARKGTIRARVTSTGPSLKGVASIEVYGLQRDPLVRKREAVQTALRLRVLDVKRAAQALTVDAKDPKARAALRRGVAEIEKLFLAADKPFLAMCRQVVRDRLSVGPRTGAVLTLADPAALSQTLRFPGAGEAA